MQSKLVHMSFLLVLLPLFAIGSEQGEESNAPRSKSPHHSPRKSTQSSSSRSHVGRNVDVTAGCLVYEGKYKKENDKHASSSTFPTCDCP